MADFLDFAELVCHDALSRENLRRPFPRGIQTPDGEAKRDDEKYAYVAAWEYKGDGKPPKLHKEPLVIRERQALATRSYK